MRPLSDENQSSGPQDESKGHIHPASFHIPFPTTGIGVSIIACIALVWMLDWAQSFFVSLLVGILFSYTLNPLVDGVQRYKIPRVIATTLVMVIVLGALAIGTYSLRGQVQTIINQLPTASSKLSAGLASLRASQRRTLQKIESAASIFEPAKPATETKTVQITTPAPTPAPLQQKIDPVSDATVGVSESAKAGAVVTEPAATEVTAPPPPVLPPVQVVVEQKQASKLGSYLLAGSVGVVGFLGQALMVVFLIFFLLLTGDTFKRKLVRIAGSSKSKRKITVTILDDINRSIQRYMLMLLVTNVLVGLLTWLAFRLIGLENAGAWAVFAGVAHLIPYFGPAVTAGATAMAAYIQFGSFSMVMLVAGASLVIATLIGTFVTTWMTGRIAKMNTAAVFISLLFWGWLWGVWGMLLAIPIVVIAKVISQHIEELHPVAELLGE